MPLDNRDYVRGEHPPACTCVDCVNARRGTSMVKCPQCDGSGKILLTRPPDTSDTRRMGESSTVRCPTCQGTGQVSSQGFQEWRRRRQQEARREAARRRRGSPQSQGESEPSSAPGLTIEDIRDFERILRHRGSGGTRFLDLAIVSCLVVIVGAFAWGLGWGDSPRGVFPLSDEEKATPTRPVEAVPTST